MLQCKPLHWQIRSKYASGNGPNIYTIGVGDIAEMWMCVYSPEEGLVTISNMAYSKDEVLSFKQTSFEGASELVKSFADGMGYDFSMTIYVDEC